MALFTHTLAARMLVTRDDPKDHDEGECELLGSFALLVQAALGLLALSSLVYKRWRERPQRPVKIWFFDVSKQVVGSVLVHIANLVLALLSSGKFDTTPHPSRLVRRDDDYHPNPCSFYLLNLAIDTTVGIAILIYSLRAITYLCELLPPDNPFSYGITSGDYGSPPKASSWIKQSVLYFAGLMFMKLIVAILFAIFPIALGKFGDFLLGWTEGNRRVQIAFVMFIFPLIMNAVQYYIIDIFIKKQETKAPHLDDEERLPIARSDDSDDDDSELGIPHDSNLPQVQPGSGAAAAAAGGAIGKGDKRQKVQSRTRSFEDSSYVYSTDEDDEHAIIAQKQKRGHSKKGSTSARIEEYDPDIDGDNTAAKR
ncbi:hypothetical protein TWF106_009884 [Orbilia oligospora]|uniref:Vacuolar membrane protein n=1 Tax=Orbilia oligospora TaxID=2813651 RepID=A0A6G1MLP4_ORBOL|nr:hypothetical protein TWF788_009429 [Orbilia oligospora]KAF3219714.1 hypothetical protein TWF191_007689 [Orbilia oligospora]KAF3227370.1 hypothetical protein TWF106_009884 [Orbilia oligospora]KAF3261827.1 hypothetical protein TWF192_008283 [Orbilia oligospora]